MNRCDARRPGVVLLNMRGDDQQQSGVFSYISAEQRVPKNHPLRPLRQMVDEVLAGLSPRFNKMYAKRGRPSIAPEKLLRALLLQVLYTIRSERQLMEQLDYNMLYRWFVGLNMDDPIWDVTVFTKNRERLLKGDIAQAFLQQVLEQARAQSLLSEDHFTVDGTLIEAWAGQKSFQRKGPAAATARRRRQQSDGELSRRETQQSDAPIDDRSGSHAVSKVGRQRIQVELSGSCVDGEPQRVGGGHAG